MALFLVLFASIAGAAAALQFMLDTTLADLAYAGCASIAARTSRMFRFSSRLAQAGAGVDSSHLIERHWIGVGRQERPGRMCRKATVRMESGWRNALI